jgi:hypothetical protein
MGIFPRLLDPEYLLKEFNVLAGDNSAPFAKLIETLSESPEYIPPKTEAEFNEVFGGIQKRVNQRARYIEKIKKEHDEKLDEYYGAQENEKKDRLFLDMLALKKEINRPLYAEVLYDTTLPLFYKIYIIALDENRHFSPLVRQAAFYALCFSENSNDFVRERVHQRCVDFIIIIRFSVLKARPGVSLSGSLKKDYCFAAPKAAWNVLTN